MPVLVPQDERILIYKLFSEDGYTVADIREKTKRCSKTIKKIIREESENDLKRIEKEIFENGEPDIAKLKKISWVHVARGVIGGERWAIMAILNDEIVAARKTKKGNDNPGAGFIE